MIPRALVVVLRVHLGVILLVSDLGKLTREAPFSVEMLGFLHYSERVASAPYRAFVDALVVPHARAFSILVMAGELVAGLSLLAGAATRVGAAIAAFLFANYMLAKGRLPWSPDSEDAAILVSAIVVGLAAAGRRYGVDALLYRRWHRRWPRALVF